jgi:hypothetical protein
VYSFDFVYLLFFLISFTQSYLFNTIGLEIIPSNILSDEIQYRVDCWVSDANGRRDFSHSLNLELRKWEMKTKSDFKILSEEKGRSGE